MAAQTPSSAAPPAASSTGFSSGPGLPQLTSAPAPQASGQPPSGAAPAGGHGAAPAGGHGDAAGGGGGGPRGPIDMKKINPYIYQPSFSMAVIGSSAFLLSFTAHLIQLLKTKCWYFFLVTQGVLMVAVGQIARAHSVVTLKETGATGPFVIASMMDGAAGTIVALGNIFTFTRVVWWVTPNEKRNFKTLLSPPMAMSLCWGFAISVADITKMVAQFGFKHGDPTGAKVEITAQIAQFFILSAFALSTYRFMVISRRWLIHGECEEKNWRKLGWTVVACSTILALRHIFTIVQLDARGADPKGPKPFWSLHEWVYWMSVVIPLFVIFTLYNLAFPGYFLPREYVGFKLDLKKIRKAKLENPWPLTISPPIPTDNIFARDDKGIEVRLTELESGKRY